MFDPFGDYAIAGYLRNFDRAEVLPDKAVKKADIYFCHPQSCQRAVEEGLAVAQDKNGMAIRPGFVRTSNLI